MKNITVSIDEHTYRQARIVAAQRDSSVSALVKQFLVSLSSETAAPRDLRREQENLLDTLWQRHPGFSSSENVSREALYERA